MSPSVTWRLERHSKKRTQTEARRIADKIEWHYTPVHASWLNIAECELSVLRRQCLRSRMPDIHTVSKKVAAWVKDRNAKQVGIDWRFTTEDARIKLKRLYPVVNEPCKGSIQIL